MSYDLPPPPPGHTMPPASAAPAWLAPKAPMPAPVAKPLSSKSATRTGQMKALAKSFTEEGLEILASIARDNDAPHSARVTAANSLLDRAHGKAVQQIETGNPGDFLDDLDEETLDRMALEAAQKLIAEHGGAH